MESIVISAAVRAAPHALRVLHYATPVVLLFFFLFAYTTRSILIARKDEPKQEPSDQLGPGGKPLPKKAQPIDEDLLKALDFSHSRKLFFDWVSVIIAATLVANAALVMVHAIVERKEGWWCGKADVFYIVGSFFVWCLFLISLVDSKPSPTSANFYTWLLALLLEIGLFAASSAIYANEHLDSDVRRSEGVSKPRVQKGVTNWEIAELLIDAFRMFLIVLLIFFYSIFVISRNKKIRQVREIAARGHATESTSLLSEDEHHGLANGSAHSLPNGQPNGHPTGQPNGYGAITPPGKPKQAHPAPPGWERPTTAPSRSWWEYLKGYSMFFPYLWPSKNRRLQFVVIICFLCMIAQRVINLYVPKQSGKITDLLAEKEGEAFEVPWGQISLYIFLRLLQGNNGLIGAARSTLWIPIGQYSYRSLSVAAFEHVHGLSLDFHLGKKTGEVLSALGKGNSINTFLEQVTFQVLPMLVDLLVAIGYFVVAYDAYYALVVAVVTFWYMYLTIRMAQWRAEIRRQMVNADREEDAVKNDSMVSYETVKYFNAEDFEFGRYRGAVHNYQVAEYKVLLSLNIMNVSQNMVFMLGLLIACFIAAYQVTIGKRSAGQFVTLLVYMAQLQTPLNFFGTFYRSIQSALINSERMLELFKEKPTVVDSPTAETIYGCEGRIDFNSVQFAYSDRAPALKGLDFECQPGTMTALVGESGGGKSTVFRLLFRFYNAQSGSIQVDGRDVQDITIDSLRRQIGVVPQDTVLFNETLMFNLRYARQDATEEEVYAACKAASIHDKILTFRDGYQTKVGERGLRLSGGEKQRVAIARTILKNPRIILLDEATASLDTDTEQHIQEELYTLGQGRTMLVIAHRLSTITQADQILVLHEGHVDERGTHEELLAAKGRYASMWKKQIKAQKAAEEARILRDRADRLKREVAGEAVAGEGSASQSEDESEDRKERMEKYRRDQERVRQSTEQLSSTSPRGHSSHGEPEGGKPPGHP